jgi:HK97 gp10 family phage protein
LLAALPVGGGGELMAGMKVQGADLIERALKTLPDKLARKVVTGALSAGARIIRDAAKSKVPVRTGALKRSIMVSTAKKATKQNGGKVVVGFRKPTSRRAHLTEFGTEHSPAEPFMRPALDEKGDEAIKKIAAFMEAGIDGAMKGLGRK